MQLQSSERASVPVGLCVCVLLLSASSARRPSQAASSSARESGSAGAARDQAARLMGPGGLSRGCCKPAGGGMCTTLVYGRRLRKSVRRHPGVPTACKSLVGVRVLGSGSSVRRRPSIDRPIHLFTRGLGLGRTLRSRARAWYSSYSVVPRRHSGTRSVSNSQARRGRRAREAVCVMPFWTRSRARDSVAPTLYCSERTRRVCSWDHRDEERRESRRSACTESVAAVHRSKAVCVCLHARKWTDTALACYGR